MSHTHFIGTRVVLPTIEFSGVELTLSQTERRVLAASNEAEEAKSLHEMAERQKRQLDGELTSVKESLQVPRFIFVLFLFLAF